MFVKFSGRLFQSWTALYEKDLKNGILNLSLFLVFLVCTWLLVVNLLHKDGGANPVIHLKAIRVSLTSNCLATGSQWTSFNIGVMWSYFLAPVKKQEPVSSTSRRGARAAYHDEYLRDLGPRITYTVSYVSDTRRPPTLCRSPIRQGGGEKCRPLDHMRRIPFIHQLCS